MAVVRLFASGFGAFFLWKLVRRLTAPKSPLADISGPAKEHWLTGNIHRLVKDGLKYNLELVEKYGGVWKFYGMLGKEQLYVSDPRAMHHIVVKDQHLWEETDMFIMGNQLIFGDGLISTLGEQHRKQRKMLNPVFSLANMRDILPIIQPIAGKLRSILVSELPADGSASEVNILPWLTRGALEYICQAAIGHSFNALELNQEEEYVEAMRVLAPTTLRLVFLRPFVPFALRYLSLNWRNKLMDWLPIDALREIRRIVNIMDSMSRKIYEEKKAAMVAGEETNIDPNSLRARMKGKDIMSIMLKANVSSSESDKLTDGELLGQMNTIIFAAIETTTSAICRILWILANKPEVQRRLRSEIRHAKRTYAESQGNGEDWQDIELPYDVLVSIPYLDAVCRETLRVHPPTSLLSRVARQPTTLPLHKPIRSASGTLLSSIPIPEGTTIFISIIAANRNKELWGPDADEWKPERWLTPSGERIQGAVRDNTLGDDVGSARFGEKVPGTKDGVKYPGVYSSMMTFLGGSRACIGFKFADMEMSKSIVICLCTQPNQFTPPEQVLTTLIPRIHFALPPPDVKEVYWKMNGLQIPVVLPPAGDGETSQVPLMLREVKEEDFVL
ncbi:cytochrome P450 [Hygrophoropsis aurantiaca]|uniref:Cytochrome P450 n=1 Tax=Hygrophoropsis aurantiaca TaxID=72124 RepID=A0ACB8AKI4_9AGAM|nr:cytochrome P450 [Hygrophoropsis aurantiaca]